jgi:hypothetical protein
VTASTSALTITSCCSTHRSTSSSQTACTAIVIATCGQDSQLIYPFAQEIQGEYILMHDHCKHIHELTTTTLWTDSYSSLPIPCRPRLSSTAYHTVSNIHTYYLSSSKRRRLQHFRVVANMCLVLSVMRLFHSLEKASFCLLYLLT